MGKFDLDSLLSELGVNLARKGGVASPAGPPAPIPATPQSPTTAPPDRLDASVLETNAAARAGGDASPTPAAPPQSPLDLNGTAAAGGVAAANTAASSDDADPNGGDPDIERLPGAPPETSQRAFVRSDPRETPRPPDSTGAGLGASVDLSATAARAAAARALRPDDALSLLWGPPPGARTTALALSRGGTGAGRGGPAFDLGKELHDRGVIAGEQLGNLRTVLKQSPGRLARDVLVEMGVLEEKIQEVLAEIHRMPFERINPDNGFHAALFNRMGADFCRERRVLPLRKEGQRVVLGLANPEDVFLFDEVRRLLGAASIKPVLVTASDINLVVELQTQGATPQEELAVNDILADIDEGDVEVVKSPTEDVDFAKEAGESPVIRYVNFIIQTALKEGASDIHVEPAEKKLKVRFRIDGILHEAMNPPHKMHAAIISRLKIMANLDISERRLPQDGRIRAVVSGRKLDLRVSTLPSVAGEKCVMRILDGKSISVGLDQLGFDETSLHIWRRQIDSPHGIILVTGPTGSGKTTTLYSSLREMDTKRLNVSTVEDPVEYHLDGITQVQIQDKIGMTFAAALRSLLRQDPDVVMVGEIRDTETAKIAVQAALTGHLVLSTLHTNDAPSSVTRLINIGVEPFLIGAALNGVLAQRLVRRICPHCKVQEELNEETAEFLAVQGVANAAIYKGAGCERCRQGGYSGRVGIYELLVLDDVTRDAIARSPNVTEFRRMCVERGMVTLRQDGMAKVAKGLTTIEEVLRVTEATI